MKELSIFIDESGDFGEYDYQCPYYIIAMVMHDQSYDISADLKRKQNVNKFAEDLIVSFSDGKLIHKQ